MDDLRFEINRNVPPNVMTGGQTYANPVAAAKMLLGIGGPVVVPPFPVTLP